MAEDDRLVEKIGERAEIVRLRPAAEAGHPSAVAEVHKSFERCFERGQYKIVVDMSRVRFPSSSFIVTLFEATARARRAGGDVRLVNLTQTAKNNILTFSPLTYLSIDGDEREAFRELRALRAPVAEKSAPPLERETAQLAAPQGAAERDDSQVKRHIRIQSQPEALYKVCNFVTELATKARMAERDIAKLKIAVYEACLNVIEHAYHGDPTQWISVAVGYNDEKLTVVVHDEGESFKEEVSESYDVFEAADHRKTGGFGLHIIRRSVDELRYQADPVLGNKLVMVKYLRSEKGKG
ncbi:MAG: ATP-binding protein [candidate division KSB1 bacterium]|nr:ATP-binding protein [candidate division KSB1 bacterium]MDZ7294567.1 ATP-binding protein [candidate division KSB1 bacterium]MDZ7337520.1 ATP-binding protein [candidate division KSB1 bacterium]MDZ7386010.1 ATP-binding protein [candidate division KSB1 bacterium]MDZ7392387.1 ATP-binding protein [candidate division KSB1 bacterium]